MVESSLTSFTTASEPLSLLLSALLQGHQYMGAGSVPLKCAAEMHDVMVLLCLMEACAFARS